MPNNKKDQSQDQTQGQQSQQDQQVQKQGQQQPGSGGPFSVIFSQASSTPIDTFALLSKLPRVTVAFPPCSDELLALVDTAINDEITDHFREYFKFLPHIILGQRFAGTPPVATEFTSQELIENMDDGLLGCLQGVSTSTLAQHKVIAWPTECCLCPPCVTLNGNRPLPVPTPVPANGVRRLFVGDVIWLFYFERMGIFQILGAILDSFATSGRLPISNGSLDIAGTPPIRDDIVALVLEVMVRQTKMGMATSTRDRGALYRTSAGWNSNVGQKLNLNTEVNYGFNTLFHKLVFNALEFYRDRRLAVAIQTAAGPVTRPSVATVVTISDTIDVLKKRFEAFSYGRNYYNALSGILWAIAGMSLIREIRTTLGIPPAFNDPHEYISAAYDILVLKRPVTSGDSNRYVLHRDCARNARDILLDLEVINHRDTAQGGEVERFLDQREASFESYRTAYKILTGVDLGASATPTIEQQA